MKNSLLLLTVLFGYNVVAKCQIGTMSNYKFIVFVTDVEGIPYYNEIFTDSIPAPKGIIPFGTELTVQRNVEFYPLLDIIDTAYGFTAILPFGIATIPLPKVEHTNLEQYIQSTFSKKSKEIFGITIYDNGIYIRKGNQQVSYYFPNKDMYEMIGIIKLLPEFNLFMKFLGNGIPDISAATENVTIRHIVDSGGQSQNIIGFSITVIESGGDVNSTLKILDRNGVIEITLLYELWY